MKNHKGSGGKGPSRKVPFSSSASGGGSRKSRRKPDDKSTLGRPVSSDSRHSKSKALPSTSPALVPKDHPTSPPVPAAWHRLFPISETAGPPSSPPPSYGFHNLERRTIVLADGSGRSYFALPPDPPIDPMADKFQYGRPGFGFGPEHDPALGFDKHFPPNSDGRFSPDFRQPTPYGRGRGLDGPRRHLEGGPSSLKRKYSEEDEFLWHRQHVMQHGNPNGIPVGPSGSGGDRINYLGGNNSPFRRDHHDELRLSKQAKLAGEIYEEMPQKKFRPDDVPPVFLDLDIQALKRAFLRLSKTINENSSQRKKYLEDGKNGPLQCVVCGRASKDFADVHGLIMHTYSSQNANLRVDHLGLHKALCVLMGWNYSRTPENSKSYQLLSAGDAQANREDLIIWPPTVIIHNTSSGMRKDGRVEGMSNREMDNRLKDLGFGGGKSKSIYGKEGHTGITVVKFANTPAGMEEAERLAEYFEKDNCGRKGWARAQASQFVDDEKDPLLVKADETTGEKKRILFGFNSHGKGTVTRASISRKNLFIQIPSRFVASGTGKTNASTVDMFY
ncbi:hypothetical protein OPV22_016087 [Ensete ventricosum]|uniref:XS domain-containing protein n=1 Tax=Ensete ventricosum TaxID=4639 RepID=A0AAV8QP35_ENSVE|nr:hypothetical protein OPV22_016087 [Ensete ventricosum]